MRRHKNGFLLWLAFIFCSLGCAPIPDVELASMMPGDTLTDWALQTDTWALMKKEISEGPEGKECSDIRVVNTEVIQKPDKQGKWIERWTVDRCGASIKYRIRYKPIPAPETGTHFSIIPEPKPRGSAQSPRKKMTD